MIDIQLNLDYKGDGRDTVPLEFMMKKAKPANWNPVCPNFIMYGTSHQDIEHYITLEGCTDEELKNTHMIYADTTMEDILVTLGKFPSKGQARKNGWSGPVPSGFNMWQIGKFQFCTLDMREIPYES